MTCNFRVGQKVVCVNDSGSKRVKKGAVYTVAQIVPGDGFSESLGFASCGILLEEVAPGEGLDGFHPGRFRPAVARKTDISIFKDMLEDKKARADA